MWIVYGITAYAVITLIATVIWRLVRSPMEVERSGGSTSLYWDWLGVALRAPLYVASALVWLVDRLRGKPRA